MLGFARMINAICIRVAQLGAAHEGLSARSSPGSVRCRQLRACQGGSPSAPFGRDDVVFEEDRTKYYTVPLICLFLALDFH
jgi:hypothetical protein